MLSITSDPEFVKIKDAAKLIGRSEKTLRNWTKKYPKSFPHVTILPNHMAFSRELLNKYLQGKVQVQ